MLTRDATLKRRRRHTPRAFRYFALAGAVLALLGVWGPPATSAPASSSEAASEALTPEQTKEVLRLFRQFMSEYPEDIVNSLESYAAEEQTARENEAIKILADGRDEIERDAGSFIGGNPDGDISLIEFFDYRCSYCKRTHEVVQKLLKADGNIRFVYKEFPILGPASVVAARAALAARKQGKYVELHNAMMAARGSIGRDRIFEIASGIGIDVERLKTDMNDPEIEKIIGRNHALAQRLDIAGTPAFIIGDQLLAGAAEMDRFKSLVKEARASCASC